MYSRAPFKIISGLMATIFIISCNLKIGETPPETAIPELRTNTCFEPATTALSDFFGGDGNEEQIGAAWDCFSVMVKEFKDKVRCKVREQCSPGEIAQFVEDNFLDEGPAGGEAKIKTVSAGLQTQLMKVKKIISGGKP